MLCQNNEKYREKRFCYNSHGIFLYSFSAAAQLADQIGEHRHDKHAARDTEHHAQGFHRFDGKIGAVIVDKGSHGILKRLPGQ